MISDVSITNLELNIDGNASFIESNSIKDVVQEAIEKVFAKHFADIDIEFDSIELDLGSISSNHFILDFRIKLLYLLNDEIKKLKSQERLLFDRLSQRGKIDLFLNFLETGMLMSTYASVDELFMGLLIKGGDKTYNFTDILGKKTTSYARFQLQIKKNLQDQYWSKVFVNYDHACKQLNIFLKEHSSSLRLDLLTVEKVFLESIFSFKLHNKDLFYINNSFWYVFFKNQILELGIHNWDEKALLESALIQLCAPKLSSTSVTERKLNSIELYITNKKSLTGKNLSLVYWQRLVKNFADSEKVLLIRRLLDRSFQERGVILQKILLVFTEKTIFNLLDRYGSDILTPQNHLFYTYLKAIEDNKFSTHLYSKNSSVSNKELILKILESNLNQTSFIEEIVLRYKIIDEQYGGVDSPKENKKLPVKLRQLSTLVKKRLISVKTVSDLNNDLSLTELLEKYFLTGLWLVKDGSPREAFETMVDERIESLLKVLGRNQDKEVLWLRLIYQMNLPHVVQLFNNYFNRNSEWKVFHDIYLSADLNAEGVIDLIIKDLEIFVDTYALNLGDDLPDGWPMISSYQGQWNEESIVVSKKSNTIQDSHSAISVTLSSKLLVEDKLSSAVHILNEYSNVDDIREILNELKITELLSLLENILFVSDYPRKDVIWTLHSIADFELKVSRKELVTLIITFCKSDFSLFEVRLYQFFEFSTDKAGFQAPVEAGSLSVFEISDSDLDSLALLKRFIDNGLNELTYSGVHIRRLQNSFVRITELHHFALSDILKKIPFNQLLIRFEELEGGTLRRVVRILNSRLSFEHIDFARKLLSMNPSKSVHIDLLFCVNFTQNPKGTLAQFVENISNSSIHLTIVSHELLYSNKEISKQNLVSEILFHLKYVKGDALNKYLVSKKADILKSVIQYPEKWMSAVNGALDRVSLWTFFFLGFDHQFSTKFIKKLLNIDQNVLNHLEDVINYSSDEGVSIKLEEIYAVIASNPQVNFSNERELHRLLKMHYALLRGHSFDLIWLNSIFIKPNNLISSGYQPFVLFIQESFDSDENLYNSFLDFVNKKGSIRFLNLVEKFSIIDFVYGLFSAKRVLFERRFQVNLRSRVFRTNLVELIGVESFLFLCKKIYPKKFQRFAETWRIFRKYRTITESTQTEYFDFLHGYYDVVFGVNVESEEKLFQSVLESCVLQNVGGRRIFFKQHYSQKFYELESAFVSQKILESDDERKFMFNFKVFEQAILEGGFPWWFKSTTNDSFDVRINLIYKSIIAQPDWLQKAMNMSSYKAEIIAYLVDRMEVEELYRLAESIDSNIGSHSRVLYALKNEIDIDFDFKEWKKSFFILLANNKLSIYECYDIFMLNLAKANGISREKIVELVYNSLEDLVNQGRDKYQRTLNILHDNFVFRRNKSITLNNEIDPLIEDIRVNLLENYSNQRLKDIFSSKVLLKLTLGSNRHVVQKRINDLLAIPDVTTKLLKLGSSQVLSLVLKVSISKSHYKLIVWNIHALLRLLGNWTKGDLPLSEDRFIISVVECQLKEPLNKEIWKLGIINVLNDYHLSFNLLKGDFERLSKSYELDEYITSILLDDSTFQVEPIQDTGAKIEIKNNSFEKLLFYFSLGLQGVHNEGRSLEDYGIQELKYLFSKSNISRQRVEELLKKELIDLKSISPKVADVMKSLGLLTLTEFQSLVGDSHKMARLDRFNSFSSSVTVVIDYISNGYVSFENSTFIRTRMDIVKLMREADVVETGQITNALKVLMKDGNVRNSFISREDEWFLMEVVSLLYNSRSGEIIEFKHAIQVYWKLLESSKSQEYWVKFYVTLVLQFFVSRPSSFANELTELFHFIKEESFGQLGRSDKELPEELIELVNLEQFIHENSIEGQKEDLPEEVLEEFKGSILSISKKAVNRYSNADQIDKDTVPDITKTSLQANDREIDLMGQENLHIIDKIDLFNAGIVILWPYLQQLFKMLEYLEEGQFKSQNAAIKAVQLLQFAANETDMFEEHQLVLNKVLCGMNFSVPIPIEAIISESEKNTMNSMIKGVLQNWGRQSNTSVEAFQESFLMREGYLTESDENFTLVVEKQTIDILLEKVPWSFSLIKLPWMKKRLKVEWM